MATGPDGRCPAGLMAVELRVSVVTTVNVLASWRRSSAVPVRLLYGEHLRRDHATAESRTQLAAALESFERLGAAPWASRAAGELRATGLAKPRARELGPDPLTPQEREIAALAAAGLSNKQIAQRLFLSHKTVGNHLFRIFPKLGITSRAALRDALTTLPAGQTAK